MPILTAGIAADICKGQLVGSGEVTAGAVRADSRSIRAGEAFTAVRGGHAFVSDALAAGASFVIVEQADAIPAGAAAVVVGNTVSALGALATWKRSLLGVRVLGITGSFGKTLTKDFVAGALSSIYRVHAAPGSYNTDVGVPLVVLDCPDDAQVIVAELGARRQGEIARLCEICRPEIGVLTGVGTTHIEIFGSRKAIARTKTELLESLPADGLAVVPSDDDFLAYFADRTSARMATVGPGGETRYRAVRVDPSGRTLGIVDLGDRSIELHVPLPGRSLMRNAAMALRVAHAFGVDPSDAARGIAGAEVTGARMEIVDIGGRTIVNDAYNANPVSTASALRTLGEIRPGAERWAVLGAMAELGPTSHRAHRTIGRLASTLGYAGVVVVGDDAVGIADGAGSVAHTVATPEGAAGFVSERVPAEAIVLVKGSLVTALRHFPELLREVSSLSTREEN